MKVAVGQFAVAPDWRDNLGTCLMLMKQANEEQAVLLALPEAVLSRVAGMPSRSVEVAQTIDGEFVTALREASLENSLTTVLTIHMPTSQGRAANTLLAVRRGEVIACYQKLHLYDAFQVQESERVDPGHALPPVIEVAGMQVGLMTCYDLRFPELALSLALSGADILVLPAAWLRGPHKVAHWETLLSARALDTTCYLIASGECGPSNIGRSRIVDPMGLTLVAAGEEPELLFATLDPARIMAVRSVLPVLKNRRFSPPKLMQRNEN